MQLCTKDETDVPLPDLPAQKKLIIYVGACFCAVFSAFLPAQTLITNIFGPSGNAGLVVLYVCFAITASMASLVIRRVGIRRTFVLSCCGFMFLFIGGLVGDSVVFAIACGINGCASSILWVTEATYIASMTQHTPETIGEINGIFFLLYAISGVVGNVIIGLLFVFTGSTTLTPTVTRTVLIVLLVLTFFASVLFTFVKPVPQSNVEPPPPRKHFSTMKNVVLMKEMFVWVPYIITWGFTLGFGFARFPTLFEVYHVPWVSACWGAGFFVSTPLLGKLSDKISMKIMAVGHVSLVILLAILCGVAKTYNQLWLFYFVGFIFGINESAGNNIIISSLLKTLPEFGAETGAIFRIFVSLSIGTGVLVAVWVPWQLMLGIPTALLIIATIIIIVKYSPQPRITFMNNLNNVGINENNNGKSNNNIDNNNNTDNSALSLVTNTDDTVTVDLDDDNNNNKNYINNNKKGNKLKLKDEMREHLKLAELSSDSSSSSDE